MDSMATATGQDASKMKSLNDRKGDKESLKMMLEALKTQQEQIN